MKSKFDTFSNTGKCDTCQSVTHLDEMVKKDFTKGLYHCVDCESDKLNAYVDYYGHNTGTIEDNRENKIQRLILWCFG